jgi:hypothetical protein
MDLVWRWRAERVAFAFVGWGCSASCAVRMLGADIVWRMSEVFAVVDLSLMFGIDIIHDLW